MHVERTPVKQGCFSRRSASFTPAYDLYLRREYFCHEYNRSVESTIWSVGSTWQENVEYKNEWFRR